MRSIVRTLLMASALVTCVLPVWAGSAGPLARSDATITVAQDDAPSRNRGRDRREHDVQQGQVIPLDAIIISLRAIYPGKPLDARGPMERGGRLIYEIVWLTLDGRQIVIIVDAQTGQVLRVRGLG